MPDTLTGLAREVDYLTHLPPDLPPMVSEVYVLARRIEAFAADTPNLDPETHKRLLVRLARKLHPGGPADLAEAREALNLVDFSTGDPDVAAEAERSIIATALALVAAGARRYEVATRYEVPPGWDPAGRLASLARAEAVTRDAVRIAVEDGASWIQVGEALGISGVEARERFSPEVTWPGALDVRVWQGVDLAQVRRMAAVARLSDQLAPLARLILVVLTDGKARTTTRLSDDLAQQPWTVQEVTRDLNRLGLIASSPDGWILPDPLPDAGTDSEG